MVQLRYRALKLSFKCLFEVFVTWFIIIWVWVWTSFKQQCCIIQQWMHHIHVYMGWKNNEMSPQATSQGETSESWSRGYALTVLHSSHQLCHGSFITQNTSEMTKNTAQNPWDTLASNWLISHLLKSKRSSLISSNCCSLLMNGSCIWFRKYTKAMIVSFALGLANFSTCWY